MDLVIIVSGNWIKKNKYVFNADSRGCRVLHLDETSRHEDFAKSVLDDYILNEMRDHIQLSYMFSNKSLKTMAHDTPPVYVSNTRQLQGFVALRKSNNYVFVLRLRRTRMTEQERRLQQVSVLAQK